MAGERYGHHHIVQAEGQIHQLDHEHRGPKPAHPLPQRGDFRFHLLLHFFNVERSQVLDGDLEQVKRAEKLEPGVVNDHRRHHQHDPPAYVRAQESHL